MIKISFLLLFLLSSVIAEEATDGAFAIGISGKVEKHYILRFDFGKYYANLFGNFYYQTKTCNFSIHEDDTNRFSINLLPIVGMFDLFVNGPYKNHPGNAILNPMEYSWFGFIPYLIGTIPNSGIAYRLKLSENTNLWFSYALDFDGFFPAPQTTFFYDHRLTANLSFRSLALEFGIAQPLYSFTKTSSDPFAYFSFSFMKWSQPKP